MELIYGSDLADIPGVSGELAELDYAARRASDAVMAAWCHPIDPAPQWVADIAIDIAAAYLANPTGVSSLTRSVDDASRTTSWASSSVKRSGPFALTDDERKRLCPRVKPPIGVIRTHPHVSTYRR